MAMEGEPWEQGFMELSNKIDCIASYLLGIRIELNAAMKGVRNPVNDYTQQSDYEVENLKRLAEGDLPEGDIVEIGSDQGGSAEYILKGMENGRQLILIEAEIKDRLRAFADSHKDRVTLIHADAGEMAWDRPIALLHLDHSHEYELTKKTLEIFGHHIVQGGYMVIHDMKPGTTFEQWQTRAFNEWSEANDFEIVEFVPLSQLTWRRMLCPT